MHRSACPPARRGPRGSSSLVIPERVIPAVNSRRGSNTEGGDPGVGNTVPIKGLGNQGARTTFKRDSNLTCSLVLSEPPRCGIQVPVKGLGTSRSKHALLTQPRRFISGLHVVFENGAVYG